MPPAEPRASALRGRSHAVLRGTARLLSGQLAAKLLDMAVYLVLARQLGVREFGAFTYAASFTLLFNVATDLGLTTVFTREAARTPGAARTLLWRALSVKLTLAPLTLALVLGAAAMAQTSPGTLALMALLTTAMLLGSTAGLFEGLLRAAGQPGRVGLSLAAGSLTGLAVVGVGLVTGFSVWLAACAQLAAQTAHLIAALGSARRLVAAPDAPASPPSALPSRRALVREALPLALSWVFIALYFRIDAVMLHAMQDERAVGLYGGIYRIFEAFAMLTVGFRSVLFPVLARAADGPAEGLAVLCRKSLRLQFLFTIAVAVTFGFLGRPILTLVLGAPYAEAAGGLAILIWALPGSFMADTLLHVLIAQRRQSAGTWAVGATALLNVLLNLVLIPRASYAGAAFATVVSEAACFALLYAWVARGVPGVGFARVAWRPLVAGAVLAGVLAWLAPRLPAHAGGLALGLLAAGTVYVTGLVLLRAVGREDLELLRGLVPGGAGRSVEVVS